MDGESVSQQLNSYRQIPNRESGIQNLPNSAYWNPNGWGQSYFHPYFRFFVVIDFEATCDKEKLREPQEIIEFPSVIVDGMTGNIINAFQIYVRPTCNRQLTDFCKELTGIQQNQVDNGVSLSEAILRHDEWLENLGIKKTNFAVVTWSNWDCGVMLESECRYKKITKPSYFNRWINLRVPFHQVFGRAKCTLKHAIEIAGLNWTGRAHCGLDDATNTARLLSLLLHAGANLSITDSLNEQKVQNQHFFPQKPSAYVYPLCYCGAASIKRMIASTGECALVCGRWSPRRGGNCKFFQIHI